MKKIAILGSTGSIGTQTLEIVREQKDICVRALAAGNNIDLLEPQLSLIHILCATLFVKVIHLENNLNKVLQNMPQVEQVENEETKNSPDADTGKNVEYGKQDQTGQDDANKKKADDGEKLKVYLTFDDGPSTNTQQILDILKQYNVKATFFVIGKTDDLSKEMYKKIVEEWHTLGIHSYSHK